MIAFTGALVGPLRSALHHDGNLDDVPVVLGGSDLEPWVPRDRIEATGEVLEALGAKVKVLWYSATRPELELEVTNAIREMFGKKPRPERGERGERGRLR